MVYYKGFFHLVFTSDLCADQKPKAWKCGPATDRKYVRFGYVRSADLVNWNRCRYVKVRLRGACSLWAPELSVLAQGDGKEEGGLMVVFTATILREGEPCPEKLKEAKHQVC